MKTLNILLLLLAFSFISSCSVKEKVIDNTDSTWDVLVGNLQNDMSVYKLPNIELVKNNVIAELETKGFDANISDIFEFRNVLYVFIQDKYKIIVLNKYSFEQLGVLDFSEEKLLPSAITFLSNATAAYVTHPNSNKVSLIDITVFKIISTITVGNSPVSIASRGNQIFVANQADNTVSVIDSRTNTVEATIAVSQKPTFVEIAANNEKVLVVCVGNGKIDTSEPKTEAILEVIDISNRLITNTLPIAFQNVSATNVFPKGIATTQTDWLYIMTQDNVYRIDTRGLVRIEVVLREQMSSIKYNMARRELLLTKQIDNNTSIYIHNERTGEKIEQFNIPGNFSPVHPL